MKGVTRLPIRARTWLVGAFVAASCGLFPEVSKYGECSDGRCADAAKADASAPCASSRGPSMVLITANGGAPFCIDETEVTFNDYNAFIDDQGVVPTDQSE